MSPPPAPLPSGSYRYEIRERGVLRGTSTVTVSRDEDSVVIREDAKLGSGPISTIAHLDLSTFSIRSYQVVDSPGSATFTDKGATVTERGGTKFYPAPVPGAPSSLFDFLVREFVVIPAMIHATGAKSFNDYFTGVFSFDVKRVDVVTPAKAPVRPDGVPAASQPMTFKQDDNEITLWYDPTTFALDRLDAANGFSFRRVP